MDTKELLYTTVTYINESNVTIGEVAQALGVTREHLSRILNKKTPLSRRMHDKLVGLINGRYDSCKWK